MNAIMDIISAYRYPSGGSEPQEKMGSFCTLVSIVSWSKTANGRSVLILGQVFPLCCGLPVFSVAEMRKGGKAIYFIYFNRPKLCFYVVINFANGLEI